MGSSNASVGQFSTPQMSQLFSAIMPMIQQLAGAAGGGQGIFTDTSRMMPKQGWYSGIDDSIKQGMWEPTNEAARNMINTMGGTGMLSARGGYSGSGQTALADLYSKSATQQGQNAWNMINPIQQRGFTNPWDAMTGFSGTGSQLTPSPVVSQGQQSPFVTYAPYAGLWALNNTDKIGKAYNWLTT